MLKSMYPSGAEKKLNKTGKISLTFINNDVS